MAEDAARVLFVLGQLAPLELAESWDNVGVIVDGAPAEANQFSRAFVTIDWTQEALDEAIEAGAELIVCYHPPIFSGVKRLRRAVSGERLVLDAVRRGLTIYSPHSALDAARGGMAEWLAQACGPAQVAPITPSLVDPEVGAGRVATLEQPLSLEEAIERIKAHLGLTHVRVAAPDPAPLVRTMAVCPGAGGSVFQRAGHVDLLLTGEMRHHDVLARRALGTAVVLTDHTNCERGYLPLFAHELRGACPGLEVTVSKRDADPLCIV